MCAFLGPYCSIVKRNGVWLKPIRDSESDSVVKQPFPTILHGSGATLSIHDTLLCDRWQPWQLQAAEEETVWETSLQVLQGWA